MEVQALFINDEGHLRSGWRLTIFLVAFMISSRVMYLLLLSILSLLLHQSTSEIISSNWAVLPADGSMLASGLLIGWACAAVFEDLPFRSLGCTPDSGWFWLRNVALGSVIGALSLLLAVLITVATRSASLELDTDGMRAIGGTLGTSLLIFVFAAAAEEILFRGYPLQTLTRANLKWLGMAVTSVSFAAVHLRNPNVVPWLTFLNTGLAGLLLAIGYLRTNSLWFPIFWHWAWNWTQGAIVGLPVSGIERIAPAPLFKAVNIGPDWLTGGAYGIEGGVACTVVLLVSTLVVWRTRILKPAGEKQKTKPHS